MVERARAWRPDLQTHNVEVQDQDFRVATGRELALLMDDALSVFAPRVSFARGPRNPR